MDVRPFGPRKLLDSVKFIGEEAFEIMQYHLYQLIYRI